MIACLPATTISLCVISNIIIMFGHSPLTTPFGSREYQHTIKYIHRPNPTKRILQKPMIKPPFPIVLSNTTHFIKLLSSFLQDLLLIMVSNHMPEYT
uniref:Uncharacterized protein n=1 Tax=Lepeophtheirus salmonis TaxID=72036 RepID=A0A0K2UAS5_LEPSM